MKKILAAALAIMIFLHIGAYEKIGLALGGGAARGLAHIGVLKALEENNIPVDVVGGTSMGAIIGALWSSGYSAAEIESIFKTDDAKSWFTEEAITDKTPIYYTINLYPTLINMNIKDRKFYIPESTVDDRIINLKLKRYFAEIDNAINGDFRKLYKPFLCIASDLNKSDPQVFTKGRLEEAVRASMAIPLVFKPVRYEKKLLFDGGLFNNIPAEFLRDTFNADFIISVDVSSDKNSMQTGQINLFDLTFTIVDMLTQTPSKASLEKLGTYIRPDVGEYKGYEFSQVDELVKRGYEAAMKKMPELKMELKRRENYSEDRRSRIEGYYSFEGRIVDEVKVQADNLFQKKVIENSIGVKAGGFFSYSKFENGVLQLYAMQLFSEVDPNLEVDTLKHLHMNIKDKPVLNNKVGIGFFSDSKAGVNIYGKYENINLFNYGGLFNVYGFAGNYIKGASSNLIFPSLGYTGNMAALYLDYHILKNFGVWDKTYDYYRNMNFTVLTGNRFDNRSILAFICGEKHKIHPEDAFYKTFAGLYYIKNEIVMKGLNKSGGQTQFIAGMNFPNDSFESLKPETWISGFTAENVKKAYVKAVYEHKKFFRISERINAGYSSSFAAVSRLFNSQEVPDNLYIDYPYAKPTQTMLYEYDRSFLSKYQGSVGFSLRYYLNDMIYFQNENRAYVMMNNFINGGTFAPEPDYTGGSRLTVNFVSIFGLLEAGIEYIYTSNPEKPESKWDYSVSLGNVIDKFDLLDKF